MNIKTTPGDPIFPLLIAFTMIDRTERHTIIIVDDELVALEVYAEMLEHVGYRVVTFDSAATALSALRAGQRAAVVVTDYRMPGMNGLEFLAELRREWPSLPVIMITACSDHDIRTKSFGLGLFELIAKPFNKEDLVRAISSAVSRV